MKTYLLLFLLATGSSLALTPVLRRLCQRFRRLDEVRDKRHLHLDTAFTMLRRFISRKPLFTGDREHIHRMLLQRGWSQKKAVLLLFGVCAAFGLLTLLFIEGSGPTAGVMFFVLGITIMLAVGHLRYHEIEEIKASVKRNVGDRRVRGANNITVRRASRNLTNAGTLAALFEAVVEVLEAGEFTQAVMIIGESCNPAGNESVLMRESGATTARQTHMRDGMIWWIWRAKGVEVVNSGGDGNGHGGNVWSLRIPLATRNMSLGHLNLYRVIGPDNILLDINYLCTLFQEELAKATERVLTQEVEPRKSMAARA